MFMVIYVIYFMGTRATSLQYYLQQPALKFGFRQSERVGILFKRWVQMDTNRKRKKLSFKL